MRAIFCPLVLRVLFFLLLPALSNTVAAAPIKKGQYEGSLRLDVDVSQPARKIFFVRETIPVKPGTLHLAYPKWIPGEHAPTGTLEGITGLKFFVNGQRVVWRRDLEDMFLLHVEVPAGSTELKLEFQFLTPINNGDHGSVVTTTPRFVMLEWNQVLFYPVEFASDQITIQANLRLPPKWQMASALEEISESAEGNLEFVQFKPVSLTELIDSPVMTGMYFKRIALTPGSNHPVFLNLAADRPDSLHISEQQIVQHQNLVKQARLMFGVEHFSRYEFLQLLSDRTIPDGLEHHQSSNNRSPAEFYTSPELYLSDPSLLPHEYVHTWNGKYGRPVGLTVANYHAPMRSDLVWIYEGLTNYLGEVLAARSGMWNNEQYRDYLALISAEMDHRPGRKWQSLRDVAVQVQVAYRLPSAWANHRRTTDFYREGSLLWLAVDTKLHELSHGKKSIDDFVRIFHGSDPRFAFGSHTVKPFQIDEVIDTLNRVQVYDWFSFFNEKLDSIAEHAPLDGVLGSGWKLVYSESATDFVKARQKDSKLANYLFSIGIAMVRERAEGRELGEIEDVLWNSPAFDAGLTPGQKIIAVNGDAIDGDNLGFAITRAKIEQKPIELLVVNQDILSTVRIAYFGGIRLPRLERIQHSEDYLTAITSAK